ncbi:MAG: ferritin family protein [Methanosarcinales archaeon]|nr:ferritin family protein [Methanosarcinales archaeon]
MADIEEMMENLKTVDDAINLALTIENQGLKFYSEKANTAVSILAKELFTYLAAEEAKHIEYLNNFGKTGNASSIRNVDPADFTSSFEMEFTGAKPGEMDVLMGALGFEQKNENFYNKLAVRAEDPDQKEFFTIMTSFEHKHLELIDGFIDAATQFRMQT